MNAADRSKAVRACVGAAFFVADFGASKSASVSSSDLPRLVLAGARALQCYILPEIREAALPTEDVDLHVHAVDEGVFDMFCSSVGEHCKRSVAACGLPDDQLVCFKRKRQMKRDAHFFDVVHFCVDIGRYNAVRAVDMLLVTPDVYSMMYADLLRSNQAPLTATAADRSRPLEDRAEAMIHQQAQAFAYNSWRESSLYVQGVTAPGYASDAGIDTPWRCFVQPLNELACGLWKTVNDVACYRRSKDECRRRLMLCLARAGFVSRFPIPLVVPFVACAGTSGVVMDACAQPVRSLPPGVRDDGSVWSRPSEWSAIASHASSIRAVINASVAMFVAQAESKMKKMEVACRRNVERVEKAARAAVACASRLSVSLRKEASEHRRTKTAHANLLERHACIEAKMRDMKRAREQQNDALKDVRMQLRDSNAARRHLEHDVSRATDRVRECERLEESIKEKLRQCKTEVTMCRVEIGELRARASSSNKTARRPRSHAGGKTPTSQVYAGAGAGVGAGVGAGDAGFACTAAAAAEGQETCRRCAHRRQCVTQLRKIARQCFGAHDAITRATYAGLEEQAVRWARCVEGFDKMRRILAAVAQSVKESKESILEQLDALVQSNGADSQALIVGEYRGVALEMKRHGCAIIHDGSERSFARHGCASWTQYVQTATHYVLSMSKFNGEVGDWNDWLCDVTHAMKPRADEADASAGTCVPSADRSGWVWFCMNEQKRTMEPVVLLKSDRPAPAVLFKHVVQTVCCFVCMPHVSKTSKLQQVQSLVQDTLGCCEQLIKGILGETKSASDDVESYAIGKLTDPALSVASWEDWGPSSLRTYTTEDTPTASDDSVQLPARGDSDARDYLTRDEVAYEIFKMIMLPHSMTRREKMIAGNKHRAVLEYRQVFAQKTTPRWCVGDTYCALMLRIVQSPEWKLVVEQERGSDTCACEESYEHKRDGGNGPTRATQQA